MNKNIFFKCEMRLYSCGARVRSCRNNQIKIEISKIFFFNRLMYDSLKFKIGFLFLILHDSDISNKKKIR